MAMYIPSVAEAAKRITESYRKEEYGVLNEVSQYLANNDVAKNIAGNGDEFHNATVQLTRFGFYDFAYALAKVGHMRYPRNTDLLGDLLCYGLHCKPLEDLEEWYFKLNEINKRFWSWRAYQFSFDYWMERLPYAENDDIIDEWSQRIVNLFNAFKENFKYLSDKSDCEKAYMMEYEYYDSIGDEEKAIAALKEATQNKQTQNKCAQCALKLADRYFGMGDYKLAYQYASLAVNIKEDQASINLGYTYYIRAMSLEWKERANNSLKANIKTVFNAYYAAYMHLEMDQQNLLDSVKKQVKNLEFEFGEDSNIPFIVLDQEKGGSLHNLLRMLSSNDDTN